MTATQLLALARGLPLDEGDERCFYCGAPCDRKRPLYASAQPKGQPKGREYLKASFTDWASVAWPTSDYCCAGCTLALDETANINGRSRQKMRNYSWLLTKTQAIALTKADIDRLRHACLSPPAHPFAIVLAVSGQKHTLFRGPANTDGSESVSVQLETERVDYHTDDLRQRIRLVCDLISATGKKKLAAGPLAVNNLIKLEELYPDRWESLNEEWSRVYGQPLSRLAIFLSPRDGRVDR